MTSLFAKHKLAIQSKDGIEKSFIRGFSRALSANWRRAHGYSTSQVSPKVSAGECACLRLMIEQIKPRVGQALTAQGLEWLRSKAIQRKLDDRQKAIVADFDHYTLTGFVDVRSNGFYVPQWTVHSKTHGHFTYYTGSWQSGVPLTIVG